MLYEKEKRKYSRLAVYHLVKYRLVSQPKSELVIAYIKDIGGGGVQLVTADKLAKDNVLQLYINFPHILSPVPCLAKVVWTKRIAKVNRHEAGLQFLEIEGILRQEMVKHIDQTRASKR
ncbi:MAG: PilZ domain-containing protein [Candidatus Omnitrophica bacterium]|nr:PilZ domain-containing protein [Candidatus Omnitrophota bacterium]